MFWLFCLRLRLDHDGTFHYLDKVFTCMLACCINERFAIDNHIKSVLNLRDISFCLKYFKDCFWS